MDFFLSLFTPIFICQYTIIELNIFINSRRILYDFEKVAMFKVKSFKLFTIIIPVMPKVAN